MKSPVELKSLLSKLFCYITWLLYQLIRRGTGRLANEAFTSNPIVFSKQWFNGLKIINCETSLCFLKKNISHNIFYQLIKFHYVLPFFLEIMGNMFIAIICCPICDVINFEANFSALIKSFFYITQKPREKCNYLMSQKSFLFKMK